MHNWNIFFGNERTDMTLRIDCFKIIFHVNFVVFPGPVRIHDEILF